MGEPSTERTPIQGTPLAPLLLADTGEFDRELDAALERLEAAADEEPSLLDSGEVTPVFADAASRHHSVAISGRMYLLAQEELEEAARRMTEAVTPSGQYAVVPPPAPAQASFEQELIAELPWSLRQHVVAPAPGPDRGFLRGAILGAVIALLACVATAAVLALFYGPQARTFLAGAASTSATPAAAPARVETSAGVTAGAVASQAAAATQDATNPPAKTPPPTPAAKSATANTPDAKATTPAAKTAAPDGAKPAAAKPAVAVAAPAQMAGTRSTGTGAKQLVAKRDIADPELAPGEEAELETLGESIDLEAEAAEVAPVVEEPLTEADRAMLDGAKLNDAFDQEFGDDVAAAQASAEPRKTVFIPPAIPEVPENLGQADVLQVVLGRKDEIVSCVTTNAASIPADAPRTMTLQWTVHPDGNTSAVTVESEGYKGTPLGACLAERIATWTFPKHKVQQAPIRFPFTF